MVKIRIQCGSLDLTLEQCEDGGPVETIPLVRKTLSQHCPGVNVDARVTWERRDGDRTGPVVSSGEYRIRCVWTVE